MGFIQAFTGALGGTFADQWKDFYTVPANVSATTGVIAAVKQETNAGRGSNVRGSDNIITNGSTVIVPEGFGLVTMDSGAFTGFIAQAGGYQYTSDDINAQSFFSGGGLVEAVIKQTWERFKFGGQPGSQQAAFYVNLKEIPDNKFGTQAEIYWDDAYLQTQAGAITRGSYTLRITDPLLFIKQFVPASYITPGGAGFDFADFDNPAANQLFTEVVSSLSAAFSNYTNDPDKGNRITRIQGDAIGFANSLAQAVETGYQWQADRGLTIVKAALAAIEYDAITRGILTRVQEADAMSGSRAQTAVTLGMADALKNSSGGDGGVGMGIGLGVMGMTAGAVGQVAGGGALTGTGDAQPNPGTGALFGGGGAPAQAAAPVGEPVAVDAPAAAAPAVTPAAAPAAPAAAEEDPYQKLTKLKGLLDAGVITQEDFDASKAKILGL